MVSLAHESAVDARLRALEAENARLRAALARQPPLDRLQAVEDRLRERERDLRSILDNLPSMIGYWDRDLRNRFGNHAYLTWFGIDPERMPGMHIRDVIGAERYRLNLPYIEGALRGEPQIFERAIPTPDGQGIRHSLANYIPDIVDGEVRGFYVLVTDITAAKAADAALLEAHAQLERRVVERTEQLRRLAVETTLAEERERQAIARDLHDVLGQILHVARIRLDELGTRLPAGDATLTELGGLLGEASRTVRSLTSQLSPPVLKRLGLAPALRWLAEEMQRQYGLTVNGTIDTAAPPLSTAQSDILFRAARELLINVIKHSGTDRAALELAVMDGKLMLTVEDAGCGIADLGTALDRSRGFGLASVRERLVYLGGATEIVPGGTGGLRVSLHLPLPGEKAAP
jgi:PAS domain S-box-containing protein